MGSNALALEGVHHGNPASAIVLPMTIMPINVNLTLARKQAPGKFALGKIAVTYGVEAEIPQPEIDSALARHHFGDWGEVDDERRLQNEHSLQEGLELISAYTSSAGVNFLVITEHDRSITSIILRE